MVEALARDDVGVCSREAFRVVVRVSEGRCEGSGVQMKEASSHVAVTEKVSVTTLHLDVIAGME
jgi:hypothetical protein